jgi:aryl-alcohol dehydrogenase-like predicted oxidoreductase
MTTPPARRPLGTTGIDISVVGAGTWAIGGPGWKYNWGPQDDATSVRALRRALDLGVNWIDTAAAYGIGHAEEVVGRVLAGLPEADRPYVFTKCGLRWSDADRFGDLQNDLRPASVRMECEASLRRLGVERIDALQFHWPDKTGALVEDSWGELGSLADEGKIRFPAVSNFTVDLLESCEKIRHVDMLQPPLSLIIRQATADVIPWCAEHRTGVIVYSPMQSGLLTDDFSVERVALMAPGDWRRWHGDLAQEFTPPRLAQHLALRDSLRPVAERHGTTVAAIANAWVLSWPGVTGAIAGSRSPDQVDGWIGAGTVTLTADDLDEIAQAAELYRPGAGPARPPAHTA